MSTFRVNLTNIKKIKPHPNADRLEVAEVYGWEVVIQKGLFKEFDRVFYVPVDSLLPQWLEDKLFGADSKIKLNKHRVKSIKIRGHISQGMLIALSDVCQSDGNGNWDLYSQDGDLMNSDMLTDVDWLECDFSEVLGITKYEPPVREMPAHMQVKAKKKAGNPNFKKYSDIENFKYYDQTFTEQDTVYISEKLHGTSFRCGWFKNEANTIWKKIKKLLGQLQEFEWCYGSRTVEISSKVMWNGGFYGHDVYGKMVQQYNLREVIPHGRAIYGEIVGSGIQKGYTYGCKQDEHKLFVYDVADTTEGHRYIDFPQFKREVSNMGLERVPELYVGAWSKAIADQHRDGDSLIGGQKVREGIVIRSVIERKTGSLGRAILKYISDNYYLNQDNSDFH